MRCEADDLLEDLDVGVDVETALVVDGLEEEHAFFRAHRVGNLGSEADQILGIVALQAHDLFPDVLQ